MFFLGGNMFLRKSNCKLTTCCPKYYAISSFYPKFLFYTSTLHFILSTMHIIIIAVQLIEGFVMTSETPGGSTQYFLDMGTSVHVTQESAYTSIFVSPQYSFSLSKIPQRVWLGTEYSSGMYILFGERIVVLLSYQWAIYVQVYELLGLISYQITGSDSIGDNWWLDFHCLWCINRSQLTFAGLSLTSLKSMLVTLSSSLKLLLGYYLVNSTLGNVTYTTNTIYHVHYLQNLVGVLPKQKSRIWIWLENKFLLDYCQI